MERRVVRRYQVCSACELKLPFERFFNNKRNTVTGKDLMCKKCRGVRNMAWAKANPEAVARHQRKSSVKPDRRARDAELRRKARRGEGAEESRRVRTLARYGITLAEYADIVREQGGGCGICGVDASAPRGYTTTASRALHVDHDHSTGEVRGVLCSRCNTGIGLLQESPDVLRAAVAYLER